MRGYQLRLLSIDILVNFTLHIMIVVMVADVCFNIIGSYCHSRLLGQQLVYLSNFFLNLLFSHKVFIVMVLVYLFPTRTTTSTSTTAFAFASMTCTRGADSLAKSCWHSSSFCRNMIFSGIRTEYWLCDLFSAAPILNR